MCGNLYLHAFFPTQHSLSGLIVSVDILERAPMAPPDVPTLEETITLLEEIVNGRTTVVSQAASTLEMLNSGNITHLQHLVGYCRSTVGRGVEIDVP